VLKGNLMHLGSQLTRTENPSPNHDDSSKWARELVKAHPTLTHAESVRYAYTWKRARNGMGVHLHATLDGFTARFPDGDLISLFRIFTPKPFIPIKDMPEQLKKYGRPELEKLLDVYGVAGETRSAEGVLRKFPPYVVAEQARVEYNHFSSFVHYKLGTLPSEALEFTVWFKQNGNVMKTEFPELFKLMMVALLITMTSVDCERGFSQMNLTKTKYRSKLLDATLDSLLRVRMRGLPFGDVPATFWDTALTEFNKGDNGVGGRRFGCPIPFTPTSVEPTAASESDEDEGNGFMDDSD
jgi:hypothetical protein